MSEKTQEVTEVVEKATAEVENNPMSFDDGVIKVDLSELNKSEDKKEPEQIQQEVVEQPKQEVVEEIIEQAVDVPAEEAVLQDTVESVIEEITDEEVVEQVQDLAEEIQEAVEYEQVTGAELPENIQKVVDFMNETNGTLEDYVKLNQNYDDLNEDQLLMEYYNSTKPHLDREDIDFLMEDNFSYDEDLDEERDIRRKKLARREELAKAKSHFDGLKNNYYEEIKGGSKLLPEQKEAVDFFNRYKKENEEATKIAEHNVSTFKKKTENVFSKEFKGFDYSVGDKKFRFKVNNADEVKTNQSDINNFVKKFLNEKNEMSDAKGYHKSLFTAMNPDKIAQHFYEQGKADGVRDSIMKSKNIDMDPRGTHEKVSNEGGIKVRAVKDSKTSKFGIRRKK